MLNNLPPREETVYRMLSLPASNLEVRDDGEGGNRMVGYAAMFDEDTVIDSWEGRFVERIARGAFRETLKQRGDRVKVLFDHGMDSRFGGAPVAVPDTLREDDRGLYVSASFVDTEAGREMRELIRAGAIDGMSFKFSVVRDSWDDDPDMPVRTLQEVKLYEVGPVTFPAYEATTLGVRSREAYTLLRSTPAESGSVETETDDKPVSLPLVGHQKKMEQQLRRLRAAFPEIKGDT